MGSKSSVFSESLLDRAITQLKWWSRSMRGMPSRSQFEARYWAAVEPILEAHPQCMSREEATGYLGPWLRSMVFSRGPLQDGLPWMPFPAIRFLDSILSADSRVFEYGAGGSSVFFSKRVGELVSVEHDRIWFDQTEAVMQKPSQDRDLAWRGAWAPPITPGDNCVSLPPTDPLSYASTDESFEGQSFKDYASLIDEYPDRYFDVVLIDGRARPSCFMHAMNKVRFGGYVVLDNAEREAYGYVEQTAEKMGFEITEFWGPGPYNDYCWRTLFLKRSVQHFALNELDRKLAAYLDFDNGVFVEAGANDGIRQSNSLYFESVRGWRGVLIEAVPSSYEECRRNRPASKVVWAALAAPNQVPGTLTMRFAGLMSVVKGGMRSSAEEDEHVAAGLLVQKLDPSPFEVEVPAATLSSVLDRCGITNIDLPSLDVEGFEAAALSGLDISRHRPRFILVEARYREQVDELLLPHYDVVAMLSHHDVLYRTKSA